MDKFWKHQGIWTNLTNLKSVYLITIRINIYHRIYYYLKEKVDKLRIPLPPILFRRYYES